VTFRACDEGGTLAVGYRATCLLHRVLPLQRATWFFADGKTERVLAWRRAGRAKAARAKRQLRLPAPPAMACLFTFIYGWFNITRTAAQLDWRANTLLVHAP